MSHYPRMREPTRGSETSQYPEEQKSTEIPVVAASEPGGAQTGPTQVWPGLYDPITGSDDDSRTAWEGRP